MSLLRTLKQRQTSAARCDVCGVGLCLRLPSPQAAAGPAVGECRLFVAPRGGLMHGCAWCVNTYVAPLVVVAEGHAPPLSAQGRMRWACSPGSLTKSLACCLGCASRSAAGLRLACLTGCHPAVLLARLLLGRVQGGRADCQGPGRVRCAVIRHRARHLCLQYACAARCLEADRIAGKNKKRSKATAE